MFFFSRLKKSRRPWMKRGLKRPWSCGAGIIHACQDWSHRSIKNCDLNPDICFCPDASRQTPERFFSINTATASLFFSMYSLIIPSVPFVCRSFENNLKTYKLLAHRKPESELPVVSHRLTPWHLLCVDKADRVPGNTAPTAAFHDTHVVCKSNDPTREAGTLNVLLGPRKVCLQIMTQPLLSGCSVQLPYQDEQGWITVNMQSVLSCTVIQYSL